MRVIQENLRLLDRTINIMASSDMPTQFSKVRQTTTPGGHDPSSAGESFSTIAAGEKRATSFQSFQDQRQQEKEKVYKKMVSPNRKYFDRPLTARLKRNTHIIFHWFIQRFGRYVPWWAEINY